MKNYDRQYLNRLREIAKERYDIFKRFTNPKTKRLAGLGYLKIMAEIREYEKKA